MDSGQCPENTESIMVYSPFVPYFKFDYFRGDAQKCWVAADCLFEAAGESRKQQFAATALVMGLIPLTLKDIAWPERRVIYVTNNLNWAVKILVLALGLVPDQTGSKSKTRRKYQEGTMLSAGAWVMSRSRIIFCIIGCILGVVASYAGLVFMEIYSKRSALGCPVPIFVAVWYVVALVPAAIHSAFAGLRRSRYRKKEGSRQDFLLPTRPTYSEHTNQHLNDSGYSDIPPSERRSKYENTFLVKEPEEETEYKKKVISAVQGADEDWPVQLAWAVYCKCDRYPMRA